MPDRRLFTLIVFTLLITIVCWWFINERYQTSAAWQTQEQALVFPEFQHKLNDITDIEVSRASGKFTLSKKENIWVNDGVGGFPAIQTRVENAIVAIASLKYKEAKTKRPELYKQLDVEDISDTAKSTRLVFKENSGNIVADLIIGKKRKNLNRQGLYIRLADTKQAWLVNFASNNESLDVRYDSIDWSDRSVLNIAPSEMKEMTIESLQGESVELYRAQVKDTKLTVRNLPAQSKIEHQFQIDYMSGLLKELSFINAKPNLSNEEKKLPTFEVEAVTDYGSIIMLKVYQPLDNGTVWTGIEAKLVNEANASEKAKLEVARITSTFKGWLIKFPRKFTDRLKIKLSDIIN